MTTRDTGPAQGRGRAVRRGLLLLVALLAWFAIAGVGGPLVGRLSEVQTNDNASVLPSDAEATTVEHLSPASRSASTLPYFVVLARSSGLTDQDRSFATILGPAGCRTYHGDARRQGAAVPAR